MGKDSDAMTPREIPIPEGPYCRGEGYVCKYFSSMDIYEDQVLDWCELYDNEVEDDRKCPRCAHPEV